MAKFFKAKITGFAVGYLAIGNFHAYTSLIARDSSRLPPGNLSTVGSLVAGNDIRRNTARTMA